MVAWMDDEALPARSTTREATYWSRSRQELWVKGATSRPHPGRARGPARLRRRHRCWSSSTSRARPATPATAPASTPTCCSPPPTGLSERPQQGGPDDEAGQQRRRRRQLRRAGSRRRTRCRRPWWRCRRAPTRTGSPTRRRPPRTVQRVRRPPVTARPPTTAPTARAAFTAPTSADAADHVAPAGRPAVDPRARASSSPATSDHRGRREYHHRARPRRPPAPGRTASGHRRSAWTAQQTHQADALQREPAVDQRLHPRREGFRAGRPAEQQARGGRQDDRDEEARAHPARQQHGPGRRADPGGQHHCEEHRHQVHPGRREVRGVQAGRGEEGRVEHPERVSGEPQRLEEQVGQRRDDDEGGQGGSHGSGRCRSPGAAGPPARRGDRPPPRGGGGCRWPV